MRIEYALTSSGRNIVPVIYAMAGFSIENFHEAVFEDGQSRTVNEVSRAVRPKA